LFIWPNIEDHSQIVRFVSRFLSDGLVGKSTGYDAHSIDDDASVFGFNFEASANPAKTKLTQTSATAFLRCAHMG
jgi:hypothetical protein